VQAKPDTTKGKKVPRPRCNQNRVVRFRTTKTTHSDIGDLMKNHSELFNAIKNGSQLADAAAYISKVEVGYIAKIQGLWLKTGEALAANGSIQTANNLLTELKNYYPANRLGEKAKSICKGSSDAGMPLYYYQTAKGNGNPASFHLAPAPQSATEKMRDIALAQRALEKDVKKAEKSGDKIMVQVCKEIAEDLQDEVEALTPEYQAELKAARESQRQKLMQSVYDAMMNGTIDSADLEYVALKAATDLLAAKVEADNAEAKADNAEAKADNAGGEKLAA